MPAYLTGQHNRHKEKEGGGTCEPNGENSQTATVGEVCQGRRLQQRLRLGKGGMISRTMANRLPAGTSPGREMGTLCLAWVVGIAIWGEGWGVILGYNQCRVMSSSVGESGLDTAKTVSETGPYKQRCFVPTIQKIIVESRDNNCNACIGHGDIW